MGRGKKKHVGMIKSDPFFEPGTSFLHKLHPVTKMVCLVLLAVVVALHPNEVVILCVAIMTFVMAKQSGMSLKMLMARLKWILVSVALMVPLNTLFSADLGGDDPSQVFFYLVPPSFLPVRIFAVYHSVRVALVIIVLSSSEMVALHATSSRDIIIGYMQLGLPYPIGYSIMVAMRYMPLVQSDVAGVKLAQEARGMGSGSKLSFKRAKELIVDRIVTSLRLIHKRIDSTSISMETRAFGKSKRRTMYFKEKLKVVDWAILIAWGVATILGLVHAAGMLAFIPPIPSLLWFL